MQPELPKGVSVASWSRLGAFLTKGTFQLFKSLETTDMQNGKTLRLLRSIPVTFSATIVSVGKELDLVQFPWESQCGG